MIRCASTLARMIALSKEYWRTAYVENVAGEVAVLIRVALVPVCTEVDVVAAALADDGRPEVGVAVDVLLDPLLKFAATVARDVGSERECHLDRLQGECDESSFAAQIADLVLISGGSDEVRCVDTKPPLSPTLYVYLPVAVIDVVQLSPCGISRRSCVIGPRQLREKATFM